MPEIDPLEIGAIGLALLVAYRALIVIEDLVRRRGERRPQDRREDSGKIRLGSPVAVTLQQCEDYRDRTSARIEAMEERISKKLDRIQTQLGRDDPAVVAAIAARERRYHMDISGIHDITQ